MINLNEIKLIGRVGQEPEVSKTSDSKLIAKLSLATSETWIDKQTNERKERTEWHRIVIYNSKLAEIIEKKKTELKGTLLYVTGKIRYEKWVDQTGKEQKTTNIILDATGQLIIFPKASSNNENKLSDSITQDYEDSDNIPF